MRTLKNLAVFVALALPCLNIYAQSAAVLNVPENAEYLAEGGVTAVGDAVAVLEEDVVDAFVSYYRWSPKGVGSNIINADVSCRFNKVAVLAEFARSGNGSYILYDEAGNEQGTYKPADLVVGLGAAYAILPDLSVSLMAKYVSSNLAPEAKGSAFGVDVNAVYRFRTLKVGLLVSNIGSAISFPEAKVQLPMLIKAGAKNDFHFGEKLQLEVGLDAGYLSQYKQNSVVVSAGADLKMFRMLSVRAGYHYSSNAMLEPSYVSAGLGLDVSVISLSAACLFGSPSMSGTLCATLGVRF